MGDESTEHSQSGRQALAHTGRRSLVAVAVSRQPSLLSARHVSGAVLGRVRAVGAVPAVVAVVAALRLALSPHHRLGARFAAARAASLRVPAASLTAQPPSHASTAETVELHSTSNRTVPFACKRSPRRVRPSLLAFV